MSINREDLEKAVLRLQNENITLKSHLKCAAKSMQKAVNESSNGEYGVCPIRALTVLELGDHCQKIEQL